MTTLVTAPDALNFSETPVYVRLSTDYALGNAPEGLRGVVQVERKTDGAILDKHELYYHPITRESSVDIQLAFNDLEPPLPPNSAIQTVFMNRYFNILYNSSEEFRVRHFDKYNAAPFADAASVTDTYHTAIYGDTKKQFRTSYNNLLHVAHDYPSGYRKTVTPTQPDFLTVFVPRSTSGQAPWTDCSIEVDVFMSEGFSLNFIIYQHFTMPQNDLVAFSCGFKQLNMYERISQLGLFSKNVFPVGYNYAIYANDTTGGPRNSVPVHYMLAQKSFILDHRVPKDTIYMAWENGLGGIETQYFPISQHQKEVEKTVSEQILFDQFDARKGNRAESSAAISAKYTVKSLVLPSADLWMMQRMIHAPIWQIDIVNNRFERVYASDKTKDAPPSHRLHGIFAFQFRKYL
jgi:hypothetical protein